jgi:quercetin dioxygenase-like cupin family protein
MRLFVSGIDRDGRSCIVSCDDIRVTPQPSVPGVSTARLHATTAAPPPAGPPSTAHHIDVGLPPGRVRWQVVEHAAAGIDDAPTTATVPHTSDTIDYVQVLDGELELTLDDGVHHLVAGDFLVLTGESHAMRGGPNGCRLVAIGVGTSPRA